ncbi:MAG: ribonuclease P protein component [Burkholderiaceae bacterium]
MGRLTLRRIRGQAAFSAGLNSRPVATSKHLAVYYTPRVNSPEQTGARLGLIVGKRFAPQAVTRNRVKRVLRECFAVEELGSGAAFVRVRSPLAAAAFSPTFSMEVRQLWHTARAAILLAERAAPPDPRP